MEDDDNLEEEEEDRKDGDVVDGELEGTCGWRRLDMEGIIV